MTTATAPSICVYMGSRSGHQPHWQAAAEAMGAAIAERGWRLIYGGGRTGLMGACASAALNAGGEVVGVIPDHLVAREVAHEGLTKLLRVPDMHTRKAQMAARSDAFIVLPGGIGTFEEFFETWTWRYLGLHQKPVGVLNHERFFDPLLQFLDNTVSAGFLDDTTRASLISADSCDALLDRLF
ncbi:LOG family protein [Kushneria aurantia]|uniref:Cytokinin riboside 5'-monophosphate phosphoribohydrolase n=1 Tax=Kushneria aurantia TaxID=504092 RepID=A0ABV6G5S4_9GAMM|nr:TIGR00730 family Rossman fold protein [Kushneria aurantia]